MQKMQNQKKSCNFREWKDTVYSAKFILNFNISLKKKRLGLVIHTYNLSTWVKAEAGESFELKTSLLYIVSSSTARATQ